MASRLDMLAAAALQGLCANPHNGPGANPHMGDVHMVAARALALGKALDALLEAEEEEATAPAQSPQPARKR